MKVVRNASATPAQVSVGQFERVVPAPTPEVMEGAPRHATQLETGFLLQMCVVRKKKCLEEAEQEIVCAIKRRDVLKSRGRGRGGETGLRAEFAVGPHRGWWLRQETHGLTEAQAWEIITKLRQGIGRVGAVRVRNSKISCYLKTLSLSSCNQIKEAMNVFTEENIKLGLQGTTFVMGATCLANSDFGQGLVLSTLANFYFGQFLLWPVLLWPI